MKLSDWRAVRWDFWLGIAFLVLVCLGLLHTLGWLKDYASNADQVPVEEVALVGERQFTGDDEVRSALADLNQTSLFTADMTDVRVVLTELPWVDRVAVRREWPNRLKVYLVEQVPVAHWCDDDWLNERAEPFVAPAQNGMENLPFLAGPEGTSEKVWEMWRQTADLLALNGHSGHSLELTERHAWRLVLESGTELELGRQNTLERVQRFIDLWPQLQRKGQPERVDLRYDTGLAVRWQNNEEQEKQKG